jgi:hypothetical protein
LLALRFTGVKCTRLGLREFAFYSISAANPAQGRETTSGLGRRNGSKTGSEVR